MHNISFIPDIDEQIEALYQRLHVHRLYAFRFAENIEKVLVALFWRDGHVLEPYMLFGRGDYDVPRKSQ
jgi:hypothetical protein